MNSHGMRLSQRVRYALSDLRFRRATSLLNVAAITLAVAYVLLLGFYGDAIFRYQESVMHESLPTKVTADCPEVTDRSLRFTDERLKALRGLPTVRMAFPRIELGVKVSLDARSVVSLPIEGTLPGDPQLRSPRMAWGGQVSSEDAHEVILGLSLFTKMGGAVTEAGPEPSVAHLQVSRTAGGREETLRLKLRIAGLVRYQPADRALVPLGLAARLDEWCANKIASVSGPNHEGLPRMAYEACVAYVPQNQSERLEAEATEFQIAVEPQGKLQVVESKGKVWATCRLGHAKDATKLAQSLEGLGTDWSRFAGRRLALQVGTRIVRVLSLPSSDPRWALTPHGAAPALGSLIAVSSAAGDTLSANGLVLPIVSKVKDFPADPECDYVCSADTLRWLVFEPLGSRVVTKATLVKTSEIATARRLDRLFQGRVTASPRTSLTWALLTVGVGHQSATPVNDDRVPTAVPGVAVQRLLGHIAEREVDAHVALGVSTEVLVYREEARSAYSSSCRSVKALVLPDELFDAFAGRDQRRAVYTDRVPCVRVGRPSRRGHFNHETVQGFELAVLREYQGEEEELWFRTSDQVAVAAAGPTTSVLAVWGKWQQVADVIAAATDLGFAVRCVRGNVPKSFSLLLRGEAESVLGRLGDTARRCSLDELDTFRGVLSADGATVATILANGLSGKPGSAIAMGTQRPPALGVISVGRGYKHPVSVSFSGSAHPGVAFLSPSDFRRAVFEAAKAANALPYPGVEVHFVRLGDSLAYVRARRALTKAGLALTPVSRLREVTLLKYKVNDARHGDGQVGDDLISVLAMAKPTFASVLPVISLSSGVAGVQAKLEGTAPRDPWRFQEKLVAGGWVTDGTSHNEIVLPKLVAANALPHHQPAACIGQVIVAQFIRERRVCPTEPALALPLRVVGVTEGETGFVPIELARRLVLWGQGKVVYNDTKKAFETPIDIFRRSGHVRCNLYATDMAAVPRLVSDLEAMGYRTEHSLDEQEGLRKLGRVLVFIVAFLTFGCLVIAGINVSCTTSMSISAKTWEIGILRAHGVGSGEIVSIFAVQGLVLGVVSSAIGFAFVAAVEPHLRALVGQTFSLPISTIVPGSFLATAPWWLFLLAAAVGVGFSLVGVVIPALGACRLTPVEALRRRE